MSKVKDIIIYYQKKIERFKNDEAMVIDSIHKLSKLPVTAELLQETGIFNVMNLLSLRSGKVGEKALPIFNKWRHLLSIAMKDRESPIKSPDRIGSEDKPKLASGNYVSTFSKSSADSNVSHCSRDTDSGKSSKYSDPNHFVKRESSFLEHEQSRPNSSSSDQNGLTSRDSYHLYEDGGYNPHLSIDNTEKPVNSSTSDGAADQNGTESHYPKNRILEPYAIEMREGMFHVVKVKSKNDISPNILWTRQLYSKDFMKNFFPYKRERDKSRSPQRNDSSNTSKTSDSSSSSKPERSPSSAKDRTLPSQHPTDKEKLKRKLECSKNPSTDRHHSKSLKAKASSEVKLSAVPSSKTSSRDSSPSVSGTKHDTKREDKKRQDRRSTPDTTTDKIKFKSIKEERSPSHMVKASNPEVLQANCDRKTPKTIDSPDNASMKFISSKKERRAIYSGKKSAQDVLSLQKCCIHVLKKNLDYLKSTRKVPYKVLKPVLEHLNPMQLYKIEEQNKYLLKETDELWKLHCNRDYRGQVPSKHDTWRIMYYKAHKEKNRKLKSLTASISASASKVKPDRQTKLTIVDSPHDPHRKRMRRGDSPIVPMSSSSPLVSPHVSSKSSPNVSSKSSPSISSKSSSPNISSKGETSKSLTRESKPASLHSKPVKKADAPLMSKLKKSMGLTYKCK